MTTRFRFAAASPDEPIVYGASAPGFGSADPAARIDDWVTHVREQGIQRVCCLLTDDQLAPYGDLIGQYRSAFGHDRVLHAPVTDHHLASVERLTDDILPFFDEAADADEPVVTHCLAGIGRTGHVLAAWLVHGRGYDPASALETVTNTGRIPTDAIRSGNATEAELTHLLDAVSTHDG